MAEIVSSKLDSQEGGTADGSEEFRPAVVHPDPNALSERAKVLVGVGTIVSPVKAVAQESHTVLQDFVAPFKHLHPVIKALGAATVAGALGLFGAAGSDVYKKFTAVPTVKNAAEVGKRTITAVLYCGESMENGAVTIDMAGTRIERVWITNAGKTGEAVAMHVRTDAGEYEATLPHQQVPQIGVRFRPGPDTKEGREQSVEPVVLRGGNEPYYHVRKISEGVDHYFPGTDDELTRTSHIGPQDVPKSAMEVRVSAIMPGFPESTTEERAKVVFNGDRITSIDWFGEHIKICGQEKATISVADPRLFRQPSAFAVDFTYGLKPVRREPPTYPHVSPEQIAAARGQIPAEQRPVDQD